MRRAKRDVFSDHGRLTQGTTIFTENQNFIKLE